MAIVAAGPAGLAAAVSAAEQGVKILVFEKEKITGGTANMGMGPLGINSKIQRANFNEITVAEALKNQMEYTHYRVNGRLVARYFTSNSLPQLSTGWKAWGSSSPGLSVTSRNPTLPGTSLTQATARSGQAVPQP
ncbi:FAD-dependent oxidoreductase [Lactobacillus delbrueckii subsp. bulgaricus]